MCVQLLGVVKLAGETGDGKSSLLAAVTGDMPLTSGDMHVEATMAYVPQESWVFNGEYVWRYQSNQPTDQAAIASHRQLV